MCHVTGATRYQESPLSGDDEDDFVFENPGYNEHRSTEVSPDFPGPKVGDAVDYVSEEHSRLALLLSAVCCFLCIPCEIVNG